MNRRIAVALLAAGILFAGCDENLPTIAGGDLSGGATTLEIRLPYSSFAADLQFFEGFGTARELGRATVARSFGGRLNAHALVRFAQFPSAIATFDLTGTTVTDSLPTIVGAELFVLFDSVQTSGELPLTFEARAIQEPWDLRTATWTMAIDSLGNRTAWTAPGGADARSISSAEWDLVAGDSLLLAVDSATAVEWADTANAARGLRLSALSEGTKVRIRSTQLRVKYRPSVKPDTVVTSAVPALGMTFIYDPAPSEPEGVLRIGGTPSWRTTMRLDLPTVLEETPELCSQVTCPFALDPDQVIFAALELRTAATDPAFAPTDTLGLDARPVLSAEQLPKSPLGSPALLIPEFLPPEFFGAEAGTDVSVPMTSFIQDIIRGRTFDSLPAPESLALLSSFEPFSLEYMEFVGPGGEGEPLLRLLITIGKGIGLP